MEVCSRHLPAEALLFTFANCDRIRLKSESRPIMAGLRALVERKRVQQLYPQPLHVAHVARHQDKVVDFRGGGY